MVVKITRRYGRWLVVAGLASIILFVPAPVASAAPQHRLFQVTASRFQYTPSVLEVNPGDRVTIELHAGDVVHGLSIDGYELDTFAEPGKTARLEFVANHSGVFRLRCSVTCGDMHPFMLGKLIVGQNVLMWRASALLGLALLVGVYEVSSWK